MAEPERFVLLTGMAATHEQRQEQRKVFRRNLRRQGYEYESWGVVERHQTGAHHGHEWQRGDFVPVETLRRASIGAGMGEWVGIQRWQKRAGGGLGTLYGVKAIARAATLYGVKGVSEGGLEAFLEDNGGRYGYWTREFFGQGYQEARKEAMGQLFQTEGADWVLMRDSEGWSGA